MPDTDLPKLNVSAKEARVFAIKNNNKHDVSDIPPLSAFDDSTLANEIDFQESKRRDSDASSLSLPNKGAYRRPLGRLSFMRGGTRGRGSSVESDETDSQSEKKFNIWTTLAKDENIWADDEVDKQYDDKRCSLKILYTNMWDQIRTWIFEKTNVMKAHPSILGWAGLTFAVLCTIGILVVLQLSGQGEDARRDEAQDLAVETGNWFSASLDRAILPLFSMAQFVQQLDIFKGLPQRIGAAGQPGSLPFVFPKEVNGSLTHRNTSGVCDDPNVYDRFAEIAANIKRESDMHDVLVSLQIAPSAVVCLVYPINNTEDFESPIFMDNTGAIGHDLLSDPKRKFIAEVTVPATSVVIAGPLPLRQCQSCAPSVEQAFIARLPIDDPNNEIVVNGETYNKYGFAVALINWQALIDRSDIHKRFELKGVEFRLTRTDKNRDPDTGEITDKVVQLAASEGFDLGEDQVVSTALKTTNNEWVMRVGFSDGFQPGWHNFGMASAVIVSFVVSIMLLLILVENRSHGDLLREMLPLRSLQKIRKGKVCVERYSIATVFFTDICQYTSMTSKMSPIQVMKMLNEFYSEIDKIASRHNVYRILTIGDAYMVTGGVPDRCKGPEGALNVALFALETIKFVETFRTGEGAQLCIRAGISSGPLVAGVVGIKRPQYTVFGDTVNAAARMESTGEKMRIQCSDLTYRLLLDSTTHTLDFEERGSIEVKGKGHMNTWWINDATHQIQT